MNWLKNLVNKPSVPDPVVSTEVEPSARPYGLGTGSFATPTEARRFARVIVAHDGVANIFRWHHATAHPFYCTYSRPEQVHGADFIERLTDN
jgi:hypothetical protein